MNLKTAIPSAGFCLLFLFACLIPFFCPSGSCAEDTFKKVTLLPMWSPQAQFAGYYVAHEKGFYQKYGVQVSIIRGGPGYNPAEFLKSGKADFAIMWLSSAIQRRAEGQSLVNLAQIVQRSALMLVAKKSSGILTPQDLNGKKINLWESDLSIQARAFLNKYKVEAEIMPQAYTVNLFLNDGVDAVSAMWYNEYHTIINSGINESELSAFFFDKYGLNFPEDGIYALKDKCEEDPRACAAFAEASLEGWRYAFENTEEALDIVLKYMKEAGLPANRMHQRWMLARMKDIIIPQGNYDNMGILNKEDYEGVCQELKNNGFIKEAPEFEAFHRTAK